MPGGSTTTCFFGRWCQEDHTREPRGQTMCAPCKALHPKYQLHMSYDPVIRGKVRNYWQRKKRAILSTGKWPCATNDPDNFDHYWYLSFEPQRDGLCEPVESRNELCMVCLPDFKLKMNGIAKGFFANGTPQWACLRTWDEFKGRPGDALRYAIPDPEGCEVIVDDRYTICGTCMSKAIPRVNLDNLNFRNDWGGTGERVYRSTDFFRWFTIEGFLRDARVVPWACRNSQGPAPGSSVTAIDGS